jgi:hypothetical protein
VHHGAPSTEEAATLIVPMFEDRGGFLTFVGGLTILTVVATGLSMVMEKRSEASTRKSDAEKTYYADRQAIIVLQSELERLQEKWSESSGFAEVSEKYGAAKKAGEEQTAILSRLRERCEKLKVDLEDQDREFSRYRVNYVSSTRAAAEEEKLDVLRLKSGKEYSNVVIKKVTPEGLEIRHEFGSARISVDDLDSKWNERFLWR